MKIQKINKSWALKLLIMSWILTIFINTNFCFAADWPMFKYDSERTSYCSDGGFAPGNLVFETKWNVQLKPGVSYSSPIIVDNLIYVGSIDGKFYVFDKIMGDLQEQFSTEGSIYSTPSFSQFGGGVYFGSTDGKCYYNNGQSFIQTDGSIIGSPNPGWGWLWSDAGWYASFPMVFISSSGTIYTIDPVTGDLISTFNLGTYICSSPAAEIFWYSPGVPQSYRIAIGGYDGYIYIIGGGNASNPTLLGKYKTGGPIRGTPTFLDWNVIVGSCDGFLYSVGGPTFPVPLNVNFAYNANSPIISSPAVADGTAYVGSKDGVFHAVGLDGSLKWK